MERTLHDPKMSLAFSSEWKKSMMKKLKQEGESFNSHSMKRTLPLRKSKEITVFMQYTARYKTPYSGRHSGMLIYLCILQTNEYKVWNENGK